VRPGVVACAVVVALAACSGGSSSNADRSATAPTTTTPAPAPAASAPGGNVCLPFHGASTRASTETKRPLGFLTDATAGVAGCLDEVTFFFDTPNNPSGTPPGYTVEYRKAPFSDGDPPRQVMLDGNAFLAVDIYPAASVDVTTPDHRRTYFGNLLLQYGDHHHLVLVRKLDDTLGMVRWVIALDEKRPFLVDSANDPTRISVYIG
jgi:hypothetical protein